MNVQHEAQPAPRRAMHVLGAILTALVTGCGADDPTEEFRRDPFHAYEIAEKCTSGPDMPRTEYEIRWPGECVAASRVTDEAFTREFYLQNMEVAMEHLENCRVSESVSHDELLLPCKAAKEAVLERYSLGHFLRNRKAAEEQVAKCRDNVWGQNWREYYPELCARAGEALYGGSVGPKFYSFHSSEQTERQAKELAKSLEWAPVRAAREGEQD